MKHINVSPVQKHYGRPKVASSHNCPSGQVAGQPDARWHALDLVRVARHRLQLRDRDIAVLRGLLSLLPANAWGQQMVVFASNRVLAARCDGIEERTLRRRLNHLVKCGLIARRSSPNGKRYQVKDQDDTRVLAYGIDLLPLCSTLEHLETLAADCRREELCVRSLKALVRDRLYNHPGLDDHPIADQARKALRRTLSSDELQQVLNQIDLTIEALLPCPVGQTPSETKEVSATDRQNVRHIQSLKKERLESEYHDTLQTSADDDESLEKQGAPDSDITVSECMEAATTARAMSITVPQTWREVAILAKVLGPAIGLDPSVIRAAEAKLGEYGAALAVLGLVEAFDRIRNPQAYLSALVKKAQHGGLDCVKMFWSMTKPRKFHVA